MGSKSSVARALLAIALTVGALLAAAAAPGAASAAKYAVFAVNDLGMHCYQRSYSGFMILPPANNLKVQVFRKGGESAHLVTKGITITYRIVGNTRSSNKTDFWQYASSYGFIALKPNVGITGNKLSGRMKLSSDKRYWEAKAIPITPYRDDMTFDPLQVASITVRSSSTHKVVATQPKVVVPVSDEMRCDLCHGPLDTAANILQAHDAANGTTLYADLQLGRRHACSECHRDNALGQAGVPGVKPLSQVVHGFHADKMNVPAVAAFGTPCYACHPGAITKCLRGRMAQVGFTCTSAGCHGSMADVADSQGPPTNREAWLQEPRCGGCHGATYAENPGQLYRNSYLANGPEGMNGSKIQCESCHGSPHAEWRSTKSIDNQVPLKLQGLATFIKKCSTCHGGESGRIHGGGGR
jgi:hypothetical protein